MSADDYYTPHWCIDSIVGEVLWENVRNFLEPCCGDGRIADSVYSANPETFIAANDIAPPLAWEAPQVTFVQWDYLERRLPLPHGYDLCLTNPPFSKWVEFADKALQDCKSVIMLGKLSMLGTQKRRDFWLRNQLSHMWCLSKRPSFEGPAAENLRFGASSGSSTDNSEYAWFGWRCERIAWRPPGIYHI